MIAYLSRASATGVATEVTLTIVMIGAITEEITAAWTTSSSAEATAICYHLLNLLRGVASQDRTIPSKNPIASTTSSSISSSRSNLIRT